MSHAAIQRALTLDHFAQAVDHVQTCGACVYGKVRVANENNRLLRDVDIDKVRPGDRILANGTTEFATIELMVWSTGLEKRAQALHRSDNGGGDGGDPEYVAYITPKHPARDDEADRWVHARDHPEFRGGACISSVAGVDRVCSIMLAPSAEGGQRPASFALVVGPMRYVEVATLGHGRTDDDVLRHELFGDAEAVLREVAKVGVVDGVAEVGPRTRSAWRRSAQTGYVDRVVVDMTEPGASGKRAEPDADDDVDMTEPDANDAIDDEQPRPAKLMCVGDDH